MNSVEWGEYKLGDLFDIKNTLSFNTDMLTDGNEYDYITRTSLNQGILQTTGFVNDENINNAGTWSLGLLQMDFFYRNKPWYAGQFVRKIIPKIEIPQNATLYFTTVLNMLKMRSFLFSPYCILKNSCISVQRKSGICTVRLLFFVFGEVIISSPFIR